MNQIARCDWLPEQARWSFLVISGLPAVSREKNFPLHVHLYWLAATVRSVRLGFVAVSFTPFCLWLAFICMVG